MVSYVSRSPCLVPSKPCSIKAAAGMDGGRGREWGGRRPPSQASWHMLVSAFPSLSPLPPGLAFGPLHPDPSPSLLLSLPHEPMLSQLDRFTLGDTPPVVRSVHVDEVRGVVWYHVVGRLDVGHAHERISGTCMLCFG